MQLLGISDNITNLSTRSGIGTTPIRVDFLSFLCCCSSSVFFLLARGSYLEKGRITIQSLPSRNMNFPTVSGTKEPHETASLIFFGISPFSIVMIWKHSTRNNKNTLHSWMATDSRHLKTVDPWENFTRPMKSSLSTYYLPLNIAPENGWFEYDRFPFGMAYFLGLC